MQEEELSVLLPRGEGIMKIIDTGDRNELLKKLSDIAKATNTTIVGVDNPMPSGSRVMEVVWYHDDSCPCSDGNHGIGSCICNPDRQCFINGRPVEP